MVKATKARDAARRDGTSGARPTAAASAAMSVVAPLAHATIQSPVGPLHLAASDVGVVRVAFEGREGTPREPTADAPSRLAGGHLAALQDELAAYFAGTLPGGAFTVPLDLRGTAFQLEVWNALVAIPYGMRTSYGELARRVERPAAVRAVGAANGANPIAIVVPCHRVVAADGSLHGYGGGLERKAWLLRHEAERGTGCGVGLF